MEHKILVSVTTDASTVPDVTADKFHGEIHGKNVVVTNVIPFSGSRRTVLALDGSGSMRGDKWPFALSVLGHIVAHAPDNLWLAMVLIGSKTEQIPFSKTGRVEIDERLHHYLQQPDLPYGRSPLIDGIESALKLLDPLQPGDSIYLVSDGGENNSKERLEKLQSKLLSKRVRLFSVLLANEPNAPRTVEERVGPALFQRLAENSGGVEIVVNGPKATTKLLKAIAAILLDEPFQLSFRVPEVVEKPKSWRLQFVDSHGKPVKRVALQYPHTLQPCELH